MAKIKLTSQEAVKNVNELINNFNDLRKSISGVQEKAANFRKLETALKGMARTTALLTAEYLQLSRALKNSQKSQRNFKTQTKNLKIELAGAKTQLAAVNAQLKATKNNSKRASDGFKGLLGGVKQLIGAFGVLAGVQLFANAVKNAYNLIKTFDAIGFALEKVAGDSYAAAESQRFLEEITEAYGAELITTTNRWVKFLAAAKQSGLTLRETEDIFRSMTKAAGVLGLKTDELTGIYLALEQMLSKGKVTTEELRRQLGERLPGAMGIMAASLGVTISELDKMLKKGQILSAEVLPDFAKAVELAYGIDQLENVDTLVAAQNRLTNAWELFVKNVFTDSSTLKKAFSQIAEVLGNIAFLLGGDGSRFQRGLKDQTKYLEDSLKKSATLYVEQTKYVVGYEAELLKERSRLAIKLKKAETLKSKEKIKEVQLAQEENQRKLIKFALEREDAIKNESLIQIESSQKALEAQQKQYDDLLKIKEKVSTGEVEEVNLFGKIVRPKSRKEKDNEVYSLSKGRINTVDDLNSKLKLQSELLGAATADFNYYKKQIEVSSVDKFEDDSGAGATKSKTALKNIPTGEEEAYIAVLKSRVNRNKAIIAEDKLMYDELQALAEENIVHLADIAHTEFEIGKRNAANKRDAAIDSLEKKIRAGTILEKEGVTLEEQIAKQREDIKARFDNEIIVAEEKKFKAIDDIQSKRTTDYIALKKKETERQIRLIEVEYNAKEKALKDEFNLESTTAKRKEQIRKELQANAIAREDAKKDVIIATLQLELLALTQLKALGFEVTKQIEDIVALIGKIQASKGLTPDDPEKVKKFWEDLRNYVLDYSQAIGDIVDGVFANRIEKINAEIEAEEYKYARLLELADGDAEAQKTLRRNQEIGRKQLEKKRLKEEQKQARARKAFAIAEIAINTAVGISNAAKKGFLGIPEVIWVTGLGVLQTAAVLAQPIPKYKDGLENAKTDHLGMINDGGRQEYIERGGNILTTTSKNAIVPLIAGDTIHKSYDDLKRKSMIMTGLYSGVDLTESKFNKLFDGINESITKGFSKAKVNNKIKLVGFDGEHRSYANSQSRWD